MRRIDLAMFPLTIGLGASLSPAPVIEADGIAYDFGEVLEGIAVVHTFILMNEGDQSPHDRRGPGELRMHDLDGLTNGRGNSRISLSTIQGGVGSGRPALNLVKKRP